MLDQTERLSINILCIHKMALQKMARLDGEPMSVVLRSLIRKAAQDRGVWPDKECIEEEVKCGEDSQ